VDEATFRDAGLYDPTAPNAADRLALLRWIAARGIGIDRMVEARKSGSITGLVADGVIRPWNRMLLDDAATAADLPPDQVGKVWQAAGFPPVDPATPSFTADDVEILRSFRSAAEMFGWAATLQFTRVMGSSLARIAEASVSLFTVQVEAGLAERAAGELALAEANLAATTALSGLPGVLDILFRDHVEAAIERSRATRVEGAPFGTARFAVGFVDLVGFTPLSLAMPTTELASIVEDFEGRAADVVVSHAGRVVKLIGDEVMFAALDPAAACAIALDLVDEFRGSAHVAPRGGVAHGIVITRGGDYYGPVVNLAARIADLAVPSEVLVTAEVAELDVGFRFEPAGRRLLKGFAEPVMLYAATR
jgi:class 3 adenylate cyclase